MTEIQNATLKRSRSGPWGTIEYFHIFLDPPDSYFSEKLFGEVTEWAFPECDQAAVEAFLRARGIEPAKIGAAGSWVRASNGIILRPGEEFLRSMSPEIRQAFYPALLKHSGDRSHLSEFVIDRGAFRENTDGLDIPESIIDLVETRSVSLGRKKVFTETAFAMKLAGDRDTKLRTLKALARSRSLVGRLRVDSETPLEKVAEWWTAGPNRTRAMPMLRAALQMRGVDSIDLLHLLPPVPRRLLNTYPELREVINGLAPDCYWTAMNFFSETASSRYLDESLPRQYYFVEDFDQASPPRRFGDVVVLVNRRENRFVHAYIHIADDIVYTKNGSGKFFPHVLMREEDLLQRYLESDELVAEIYRFRAH